VQIAFREFLDWFARARPSPRFARADRRSVWATRRAHLSKLGGIEMAPVEFPLSSARRPGGDSTSYNNTICGRFRLHVPAPTVLFIELVRRQEQTPTAVEIVLAHQLIAA